FTGNTANWGGAITNWGDCYVTNALIAGNTAAAARPGIDAESPRTSVTFLVSNTHAGGEGSLASAVALASADQSGVAATIGFDPSLAGQTLRLATPLHLSNTTPGESFTIDTLPKGLTVEMDGTSSDFL